MEQLILFLVVMAVLVVFVLIDQRHEKQVKELDDALHRVDLKITQLRVENTELKEAIIQHCMLTECVNPDMKNPYDTISKVIDYWQTVAADDSLRDVGCGNIDIGEGE